MQVTLPDRAVALIIKNNKTLLWWQYRNGKEEYSFGGGTYEEGETIEETLSREVFEEFNLKVTKFTKVLENTHEYTLGDVPGKEFKRHEHYFLITEFEGEIKIGEQEFSRQSKDRVYRPVWLDSNELEIHMGDFSPRKIIDLIQSKL